MNAQVFDEVTKDLQYTIANDSMVLLIQYEFMIETKIRLKIDTFDFV